MKTTSAALAFIVCLAPAAASAQVADLERAAARALGREGHAALDRKDWVTAADRFARADALLHAPTFLLGLAQAQVGLGKLANALETYGRIVREPLPTSPPPAFTKAVEVARRELDALAPRVPRVIIRIAGAGAAEVRVTVDDVVVPSAALGAERAVDPGRHVLRAEAAGLAPVEAVLTGVEGKVEALTLEFKPAPAAPPPPPAATPALVVPPPAVTPAPPPQVAPSSTQKTLGIVEIALGGAGIALGAAMGGVVIAKHGDIAKSCPGGHCPGGQWATLEPQVASYHTYSAVSTAGFVTGGILAGAGVVLLVTAPGPQRPAVGRAAPRITFTPVVGPGYAGAQGTF
jgi:hypothetical protein